MYDAVLTQRNVCFADDSGYAMPALRMTQVAAVGGAGGLPQHPLPHIAHPPPQLPSLPQLAAKADAAEQQRQQHWRAGAVSNGSDGFGIGVRRFGEAAAAEGCLGRFPGCEVMPLVQRFLRTAPAAP